MSWTVKSLLLTIALIQLIWIFFSSVFVPLPQYSGNLSCICDEPTRQNCPECNSEVLKDCPSVVERKKIKSSKKVIVTATSSNHFTSLHWLLVSIRKYEPTINVIAYDLGLSQNEVDLIHSMNGITYKKFEYSKYPGFFNIHHNAGQYAWKVAIIHEVLEEYEYVVWMDGGDELIHSLDPLWPELEENGFFSPSSGCCVKDWTVLESHDELGISRDKHRQKNNCNAAFIAFYKPLVYDTLIKRWYECALIEKCIAPPGSSRLNHRQDQAILTLLVHDLEINSCHDNYELVSMFNIHQDGHPERGASLYDILRLPSPNSLLGVSNFNAKLMNKSPSSTTITSISDIIGYLLTKIPIVGGITYLESGNLSQDQNLQHIIHYMGSSSQIIAFGNEDISLDLKNQLENVENISNTIQKYTIPSGGKFTVLKGDASNEEIWKDVKNVIDRKKIQFYFSRSNLNSKDKEWKFLIEDQNLCLLQCDWILVFDSDRIQPFVLLLDFNHFKFNYYRFSFINNEGNQINLEIISNLNVPKYFSQIPGFSYDQIHFFYWKYFSFWINHK